MDKGIQEYNLNRFNNLPDEKVYINEGEILVETNDFGETIISNIKEYLGLSREELDFVETYEEKGYYLIGERYIDDDYPNYIKDFFIKYSKLIKSGEEIEFSRVANKDIEDRIFKNFVMIKLELPVTVDNIRDKYMPNLPNYKEIVSNILNNLEYNK